MGELGVSAHFPPSSPVTWRGMRTPVGPGENGLVPFSLSYLSNEGCRIVECLPNLYQLQSLKMQSPGAPSLE